MEFYPHKADFALYIKWDLLLFIITYIIYLFIIFIYYSKYRFK